MDALALPETGNIWGTVYVLMKTEIELTVQGPDEAAAIVKTYQQIRTRGDLRRAAERVEALVKGART